MTSRTIFVRRAAVYLAANVVNAAIPFLLLPILTRVLTPTDYGTVAMFIVVMTALGAFAGLSVHGAIGVRYFQIDREALAEYVTTCLFVLACSGAVTLAVVAALQGPLERAIGVPPQWLLAAVVAACLYVVTLMRLSLWQAAGNAAAYAFFQVGQSVLNLGLSLVLVLSAGLAWQGRAFGHAFAAAAFGLLAIVMLRQDGLLRWPSRWKHQSRDALTFGVPLIPHVLGGLAVSSGAQVLVTSMFGLAETGLYVVAAQLGGAMALVADAFVKSYGPWLYKRLSDDSATSRHFVVGVTYCLFASFLIISALVSTVLFFAFPLVIGDRFGAARLLSAYFVFANGFVGMYYAVAGLFFFSSKTHVVSVVTVVSGALSLFLMWILGRRFGIEGVAVGYLSSNVSMFAMAWLLSNRTYPLPWLQLRAAVSALSAVGARNG